MDSVLWGPGGTARAEQVRAKPKPRAQSPMRRGPKRPLLRRRGRRIAQHCRAAAIRNP
jgi:hypothetical protein